MTGRLSLTFDDGLANVHSYAMPELERKGLTATVFVISDCIGGKFEGHSVMSENMLVDLCSKGWEIGSHTKTHPVLSEISSEQIERELKLSRLHLESVTHQEVVGLGYPYGDFDDRTLGLAAKYYQYARATVTFPPLKLNPLKPSNKMKLVGMSSRESSFTLPIHLLNSWIPRNIKRSLGRVNSPRSSQPARISVHATRHGLDAGTVTKWIRKCMREKRWLILNFHNVSPIVNSVPYTTSLQVFRQIIEAAASGPEVLTLREAFVGS